MRRALVTLAILLVLGLGGAPAAVAAPDVAAAPVTVAVGTLAAGTVAVDTVAVDTVAPGTVADGTVAAAAPGWVWPVEGPRRIVRAYLAPATPYSAGHRGVDLGAARPGVDVVAVTSGVVHFAGVVVDRPVITVRQGQLLATVEPVTPLVAVGDRVETGQVIGTLEPGHCARPCVHLGVRVAGEYVSPLLYLGGLERAVLLPLD